MLENSLVHSIFYLLTFSFSLSPETRARAFRTHTHTHTHTHTPNAFRVLLLAKTERRRESNRRSFRSRAGACIQRERGREVSKKVSSRVKIREPEKKKRKEKATTKRRRGKSAGKKRKRITADDDIDDDEIERLFWPLRGRVEDKHQ